MVVTWVEDYLALEKSGDSIMELINERNSLLSAGGDALKITAEIRVTQNNFNFDFTALQRELKKDKDSKSISPKEFERRTNMLNEAKIRKMQITKAFEEGSKPAFRGGISNRAYEAAESEQTLGYSNSELMQQHQSAFDEQEQGLSRISGIVRRQKEIGLAMGDELDEQNDLLGEIQEKTEATGAQINRQTRAIGHVSAREGNLCGYWITIILLFVAIIAVIFWKVV